MNITLMHAARLYTEVALSLSVAFLLFSSAFRILGSHSHQITWLTWAKVVVVCAFLLPVAVSFIPRDELFRPTAQIWSGVDRSSHEPYLLLAPLPRASVGEPRGLSGVVVTHRGAIAAGILFLLLFGALTVRLALRVAFLRGALEALPMVRRQGRLRIVASEAGSPFSAWVPGHDRYVVLPMSTLSDRENYRISLRHEMQHHRQGDTAWIYLIESLKILFFWNPAIFGWGHLFTEIQEFACDETLIGRRKISPHAYGRCLLQAAEHAVRSRERLVGTTCFAASVSGQTLERRIKMILNLDHRPARRFLAGTLGLATLAVLGSAAFASRSALQDRVITMADAMKLTRPLHSGTEIPLNINEKVVAQLNEYVGTPEGREFIRNSLHRMQNYQGMIGRYLDRYQMPKELFAVPVIESGYKDYYSPTSVGAGLWGFVVKTAQRYKLVVTVPGKIDERLDEEKETRAAMDYLTDLFAQFHDWRLALKAYNEGEYHVQDLIDQYGSEDAWYLETVAESKEHYLSRFTAVALILNNPSLLQ